MTELEEAIDGLLETYEDFFASNELAQLKTIIHHAKLAQRYREALMECMNEFGEYMYDDPANRNTREQVDEYLMKRYDEALNGEQP